MAWRGLWRGRQHRITSYVWQMCFGGHHHHHYHHYYHHHGPKQQIVGGIRVASEVPFWGVILGGKTSKIGGEKRCFLLVFIDKTLK